MHEIYAFGVIAPSTLVELEGSFPAEAGYGEIAGKHPSLGGEAAGGAYVLARLGVGTKLSGTKLGNDPESLRVIELLTAAGVDCSAVATDAEAPGQRVRPLSRFGADGVRHLRSDAGGSFMESTVPSGHRGKPDRLSGSVLRGRFRTGCTLVPRDVDSPRHCGCVPESDIARHASVTIVSEEFASRSVDVVDVHDVHTTYTLRSGGLVILTQGDGPLLYGRAGDPVREFVPFPIESRDTTGAGDSFRAGVIYGMLKGFDDARLVEIGSAVSAMVCEGIPGVLASPTKPELESFLRRGR